MSDVELLGVDDDEELGILVTQPYHDTAYTSITRDEASELGTALLGSLPE